MKIDIYRYASLFFVIIFILSMNPFFIWGGYDSESKILFLLLFLIVSLNGLIIKKGILKLDILFFITYYAYVIYIFVPFRTYDFFTLGFVLLLIVPILLLVNDKLILNIKSLLVKAFVLLSVGVIVSTIFRIVNIPFPEVIVEQTFRASQYNYYIYYYFNVILNTTIIPLPGGGDIYRASSIFAEPGHFGLYLCFIICLMDKPFSSKQGYILISAMVFTFSLSSFICLLVIYCLRGDVKFHKLIIPSLVLALLIIGIYSYNYELFERAFIDKLNVGSVSEILTERSTFSDAYFNFDSFNLLFGFGRGVLSHYDIVMSDFRMPVIRFGLMYYFFVILIIACAYFLVFNKNGFIPSKFNSIVIFFFLIMLHRSFMVDSFYFWASLIIAYRSGDGDDYA